jgi:transcriptional regulator with XRE-family HTH domain
VFDRRLLRVFKELRPRNNPDAQVTPDEDESVLLSKKCGIAQSHLSDMENDKRSIGKIPAQKLSKALGCDYKRFL